MSGNSRNDEQTGENRSLLRFLTCGSVDDGKSTLIGRLLLDTGAILDDQIANLKDESARFGTTGQEIDLSLLVDGLEAEREQGITIDVAYRFFSTTRRKFIVADTPGHEQFTRNMATGASGSDVAVLLVDARNGIQKQTRRHSLIVSLLGLKHVVVVVNKIDLVGYSEKVYKEIVAQYSAFAEQLGFETVMAIPLSARFGDNVIANSPKMKWYTGATLLQYLENLNVEEEALNLPFRFPVQYVSRPNQDFRGFAGQIASGKISVGDPVVVSSSGIQTHVKNIVTMDGNYEEARAGQAVTLQLDDEIDLSRGDILTAPRQRPVVADQLQAHIIWFDRQPLMPGRNYILRTECDSVGATITDIKHCIDIETQARIAARTVKINEFAVCNVSLQRALSFDPYRENKTTGNFILIDRMTNATVGAGMIDFALSRALNVHWQTLEVNKAARSHLMKQQPRILWFTGLPASGKSTIANLVEKLFHADGRHTILLDGDNIRHGLSRDLGFTEEDRVENIRRVVEVSRLMTDAGLIVIVCMISPYKSERQWARELIGEEEFIEVYVDTPLHECISRDPKGLYKRARKGEIRNFTGIDAPYEAPENPEIRLCTTENSPQQLAQIVFDYLQRLTT
ncbi:sulfate adenylyltransferase subunit CysN [Brucella intermedia]|uniref:sulfate adenylyltransferase subunit CysN n=1 Tax=Brucella intermedia TaxID=94625 RepID=UPI00235E9318|nr:sulfate adenylyltransferase subunit CysN [Brucella intermedia]